METNFKSFKKPEVDHVIEEDLCIGCGFCAKIAPDNYEIVQGDQIKARKLNPLKDTELSRKIDRICPFSNSSHNENYWMQKLYSNTSQKCKFIGDYDTAFAFRTGQSKVYGSSSSGGFGRSFAGLLLDKGIIESVVSISSSSGENKFSYQEYSNSQALYKSSTSAYYPTDITDFIDKIVFEKKRTLIFAIPCLSKVIRNYMAEHLGAVSHEDIIIVGVLCGHMKSKKYAQYMANQIIENADKQNFSIDFRKKVQQSDVSNKCISIKIDQKETTEFVRNLDGTDYGLGYFKYKACDYCDDVFAETSDIVVGDAWLEKYLEFGTSLVINRNSKLNDYLEELGASAEVYESLDHSDILKSQDAAIRHRKLYMTYRIGREFRKTEWIPLKRNIITKLSFSEKRKQDLRIMVRDITNLSQLKGNKFEPYFINIQLILIKRVYNLLFGTLEKRVIKMLLLPAFIIKDIIKLSKRIGR